MRNDLSHNNRPLDARHEPSAGALRAALKCRGIDVSQFDKPEHWVEMCAASKDYRDLCELQEVERMAAIINRETGAEIAKVRQGYRHRIEEAETGAEALAAALSEAEEALRRLEAGAFCTCPEDKDPGTCPCSCRIARIALAKIREVKNA